MADRPILFSAPMVRALRDGRKTQTRRILSPSDIYDDISSEAGEDFDCRGWHTFWHGETFCAARLRHATGDRLWVRETWKPHSLYASMKPREMPKANVFYRADNAYAPSNTRWVPGIHMPRWASRLTLPATEVRAQRLQDISEEDARAEGVEFREGCWGIWNPDGTLRCGGADSAREAFRCLWININGNGAWEADPWVSATTFTVHRCNIDTMEAPRG